MKRRSPIAGSWYAGEEKQLKEEISNLFLNTKFGPNINWKEISSIKTPNRDLIGVICPHAGYVYSGSIAAWSYATLKSNYPSLDTVVILGPNHRGSGPPISIYPSGSWEFPNGILGIDEEITEYLRKENKYEDIEFENTAHQIEHSIDIQCPFLTELYGSSLKIIPICIKRQSITTSSILAELLLEIFEKFQSKKIAIVASSDLSHEYEYSTLERNDKLIIESILSGDPEELDSARMENRVTMCGYGPVLTLMILGNKLGKLYVEKNAYSNSRLIKPGGDYTVGYFSGACYLESP